MQPRTGRRRLAFRGLVHSRQKSLEVEVVRVSTEEANAAVEFTAPGLP